MASPDVTPYVDLTIYDKDPEDIFNDGVVNVLSYAPEWVPREGNMEVVLLESIAVQLAQVVFSLNRQPGAILEVLLQWFGVERDLGAPVTGLARFHVIDDEGGHAIPAGTQVSIELPDSVEPLVLETTSSVVSHPGQLWVDAPVVGVALGEEGNGLTSIGVTLIDALTVVEYVELSPLSAGGLTGGRNPEEDESWFARAMSRFQRLNDTLVLPRHFRAAALEFPGVQRVVVLDNTNPASPGTAGTAGGHVTVAVYGASGPLSASQRGALHTFLAEKAMAALTIHIREPLVVPVDVTVKVRRRPQFTVPQVQAAVAAALTAWIDPATWVKVDPPVLNRYELGALIDALPEVSDLVEVTKPVGESVDLLALPGAPTPAGAQTGLVVLPRVGTVVVDVLDDYIPSGG